MTVALKSIAQVLVSFILIFYAIKLSTSGFPVTSWFLCGALLALSYQFILVPKEKRSEGKVFLYMIGTGVFAAAIHYLITLVI